ncbi:MAG: ATP-binding protein [Bacteroidota bacterium]
MLDLSHPNARAERLGVLTHGSLNQGVAMKLDAAHSIEEVVAGTFVVIQGEQFDFFSMITDVRIEAANDNILLHPPGPDDDLLRLVLQGAGTYATVSLKPMLMLPNRQHQDLSEEPARSVKTVPAHFSIVARADEDDVARIFGSEANDARYFYLGEPLGMDGIPVCIDLARFVERSNAVFGKTGTGKTFLTRLLLCGTIRSGMAVNLIFDMHSEYGLRAGQEGDQISFVRGLKELFPSKVSIYSLDPKSTRQRGATADVDVYLYADQIDPEDILPLRDTLNLNATAAESSYLLKNKYGRQWLLTLLRAEGEALKALADEVGAHEGSVSALRRKLARYEQDGFFKAESSRGQIDVIDQLLEAIDAGKSIVLEFGRYDSLRVYMLVANVLTRRLRERYEDRVATYQRTQDEADK